MSKGAREVFSASMSVQPVRSAESRCRIAGFGSTLATLEGWRSDHSTAEASAPALSMIRSSIWPPLSPWITTMRSGYALRTGSVAASQWGLRTSTSFLPRA